MSGLVPSGIMSLHIAGGVIALVAGTWAAAARKGSRGHTSAGKWFFGSMLLLGVTAAMLTQFRTTAGSPLGGVMVCYFVATSWWTARRRDGRAGPPEVLGCATALALGAAMIWGGSRGATTPAGAGPFFALGGVCLIAGVLDLSAILRRKLSPPQRIARHLWRVCFAFFFATGSFFLGQQGVLPVWLRGSPILFLFAFAPFVLMIIWLVRVRVAKWNVGQLSWL
jgi:hypothetical protein